MNKPLRLGIVGSGNIVRTRHIPAIRALGGRATIVGISDTHAERAREVASAADIPRAETNPKDSLSGISWLDDVDAIVIATPPFAHGRQVIEALSLGKHVLVEKPFVVDLSDGRAAITEARRREKILCVNHNFQYSRGFRSLERDLHREKLGKLRSIYSLQLSNDTRRLPIWSELLPFGLFYDESPHVFYLLRKFGSDSLELTFAHGTPPSSPQKTTPHTLTIELQAGSLPASVHVDFESPLCEWYFAMLGERGVGYVDLFRDIYTFLPNDGKHLMREVLTSSSVATLAHWRGFANNGWAYLRHKLLYGFEQIYTNFVTAAQSGDSSLVEAHSAERGLAVNELQHAVIERIDGQHGASGASAAMSRLPMV